MITEDRVHKAFSEFAKREAPLIWIPLYQIQKSTTKIMFHNVNSLMPHLNDILADESTMAADICFSSIQG